DLLRWERLGRRREMQNARAPRGACCACKAKAQALAFFGAEQRRALFAGMLGGDGGSRRGIAPPRSCPDAQPRPRRRGRTIILAESAALENRSKLSNTPRLDIVRAGYRSRSARKPCQARTAAMISAAIGSVDRHPVARCRSKPASATAARAMPEAVRRLSAR